MEAEVEKHETEIDIQALRERKLRKTVKMKELLGISWVEGERRGELAEKNDAGMMLSGCERARREREGGRERERERETKKNIIKAWKRII